MSTKLVQVVMRKKYQSWFPGERPWFPAERAETLVASNIASALDENGRIIRASDDDEDDEDDDDGIVQGEGGSESGESNDEVVGEKHKFIIDGLSPHIAGLLVGAGLTTPAEVFQYLTAGKKIEAIKGIGDAKARDIVELYGDPDNFGEEDGDEGDEDDDEDPGVSGDDL